MTVGTYCRDSVIGGGGCTCCRVGVGTNLSGDLLRLLVLSVRDFTDELRLVLLDMVDILSDDWSGVRSGV